MKNLLIVSGLFVILVAGGALIDGLTGAVILFLGWCWITYEYYHTA